jgi:sterol desaturase/sphingolipid hydroxylase (fatty acid hydroxylase superfamily)
MEKGLRSLAALTVYPVILSGACVLWWALCASGQDVNTAAVVTQLAVFLCVWMLEQALPYCHRWQQPQGDRATDSLHLLVSLSISVLGLRALRFVAAPRGAAQLTQALPQGSLFGALGSLLGAQNLGSPWPHHWPLAAQLALALVLAELGGYASHRALHTWACLWPIHAVHHSALRLYFLNASRNHPIDMLISVVATFFPLVLLGMNEAAFALFGVFTSTHLLLQHSNIEQRTGPLSWIFSTAHAHRWHHSRRREEADANYGQVLLIWDVLFGTRRVSQILPPPVAVGFEGDADYPRDYLGQLVAPFRHPKDTLLH